MEILSESENTPYQVRLEFSDIPTNIGNEIREILKERYIKAHLEKEGSL